MLVVGVHLEPCTESLQGNTTMRDLVFCSLVHFCISTSKISCQHSLGGQEAANLRLPVILENRIPAYDPSAHRNTNSHRHAVLTEVWRASWRHNFPLALVNRDLVGEGITNLRLFAPGRGRAADHGLDSRRMCTQPPPTYRRRLPGGYSSPGGQFLP